MYGRKEPHWIRKLPEWSTSTTTPTFPSVASIGPTQPPCPEQMCIARDKLLINLTSAPRWTDPAGPEASGMAPGAGATRSRVGQESLVA